MKSKITKHNKKQRKITSKRQNKKQKGGILLKMEAYKAFSYFISNSNIELLTDGGSFGVIFKASFNKNLESPYEMFGPNNFKQPVNNLLIKIVALSKYELDEDDKIWSYLNGATKHIDLQENFIKEVNIQTDIFFKTMEYLEPLCPAPVYSTIINDKIKMQTLIGLLEKKSNDPYTKSIFYKIIENVLNDRIPSLGVLGMEIADGFDTMSNFYYTCEKESDPTYINYYEWCEQMGKLQILDLALKTGYSHNDFHRSNLLINPRYKGFYKGLNGKIIIIDFGFATKISIGDLDIIRENYKEGKYSEALKVFETFKRSDNLSIEDYPTFYGWLYNNDAAFTKRPRLLKKQDFDYDKIINELKQREEIAIDDRIKYFDDKHKLDPNNYPLLPLSNAIKKSFYQGMINGGGKKNKTKKRRSIK